MQKCGALCLISSAEQNAVHKNISQDVIYILQSSPPPNTAPPLTASPTNTAAHFMSNNEHFLGYLYT